MTNFDQVNKELYDLLKDRLKLKEYCKGFTLRVEFGEAPQLEEYYYLYPKVEKEANR